MSSTETINSSDIISSDVCSMSIYAATKDQRYESSGDSGVLAATIVGLIVGIALIVGLVILAVYLGSRHSSHNVSVEKHK